MTLFYKVAYRVGFTPWEGGADPSYPYSPKLLEKPSEKSRTRLRRSLTGCRKPPSSARCSLCVPAKFMLAALLEVLFGRLQNECSQKFVVTGRYFTGCLLLRLSDVFALQRIPCAFPLL
jgi:hypothetical protein